MSLSETDIPPLYVSPSWYDDMGAILDELGLAYNALARQSPGDIDEGVVMINCGSGPLESDWFDRRWFDSFITDGGYALLSDWAGDVISELGEATFDKGTRDGMVTASIEDEEFVDLIGESRIELEFDLSGWYRPEDIPSGGRVLLRHESGGERIPSGAPLAYQFSHGDGAIIYTAFHNHEQVSDVEEALLRLLLMVPISEAAGTSLTKTYAGLTKAEPSTSTELKETGSGGDESDDGDSGDGAKAPPSVQRLENESGDGEDDEGGPPSIRRVEDPPAGDDEDEGDDGSGATQLVLVPDSERVGVGEELMFTLRDGTGSRLEGAVVRANGDSVETDSRGRCTLRFGTSGEVEVRAEAPDGSTEAVVTTVVVGE